MPELEALDDTALRAVIVAYRDALRAHQERLNRLNVYPVPDGDTGTNMALTLESVVTELDGATGMEATCKALAHGSLMGARGNSGVILSQILRAVAGVAAEQGALDAHGFTAALRAASDAAYSAVMEPVEGTILTVARESAEAAERHEGSLAELLDPTAEAARAALERTPSLLPVLAEAGVVDAGGAGFVLFLDACLNVVAGRPVPDAPPTQEVAPTPVSHQASDAEPGSTTRYEVMYFLEAPDDAIDDFKKRWASLGDSIVVVGGDGMWNCHIHTDDIGASVEAALDAGRPRQIRVTDLVEQIAENRSVEPDHVTTAVVAVGMGAGIENAYRELGAQQVVAGGQTMNPSTAQVLEAVNATRADAVVILPNNSNIVAVAEQAAALADRPASVVPTKGLIEGLAALLQYDPKAELEANVRVMTAGARGVVSGEVTRAVRAARSSAGDVAEGDWLGLSGGDLRVVRPQLAEAVVALLDELVTGDHELVTLVEGEGSAEADTERVRAWVEANRPNATIEVHSWGHPLSAYLISIE